MYKNLGRMISAQMDFYNQTCLTNGEVRLYKWVWDAQGKGGKDCKLRLNSKEWGQV